MAQPIVDGIKKEMGDEINLVQLNLLSSTGREASRAFGVFIVPTTLLFNGRGEIILRKMGMPDADRLRECISEHLESKSSLIQQQISPQGTAHLCDTP